MDEWAYGRKERRPRKKHEKWTPQERILETSNDEERRREVNINSRNKRGTERTKKDEQRA